MSEWISVEDELPTPQPGVLYWDGYKVKAGCITLQPADGSEVYLIPWANKFVTHWMPLPEPPQKEGEG